jgi:Arc/MetJ-type ribon-helix-helix transcriptional regulator
MKRGHALGGSMSSVKIAITIDSGMLTRIDGLVARKIFPNRSRAIESAVAEKLARMERGRLASECAKLDSRFEKALAEEGLATGSTVGPKNDMATETPLT